MCQCEWYGIRRRGREEGIQDMEEAYEDVLSPGIQNSSATGCIDPIPDVDPGTLSVPHEAEIIR